MKEPEKNSFENNFNKYFMETEKKEEGDGKAGANQNKTESKQSNPFDGFDMKNLNIPEWLMHLLTGLGAMGGNYILWIKPIQDKLEAINLQLSKHEKRIEELEDTNDKLIHKLKDYEDRGKLNDDENFLHIKRNREKPGNHRYRSANM